MALEKLEQTAARNKSAEDIVFEGKCFMRAIRWDDCGPVKATQGKTGQEVKGVGKNFTDGFSVTVGYRELP